MEASHKRFLGIITVAIITAMVTALLVLRTEAVEQQRRLQQSPPLGGSEPFHTSG
jgi:hypothetical protein